MPAALYALRTAHLAANMNDRRCNPAFVHCMLKYLGVDKTSKVRYNKLYRKFEGSRCYAVSYGA